MSKSGKLKLWATILWSFKYPIKHFSRFLRVFWLLIALFTTVYLANIYVAVVYDLYYSTPWWMPIMSAICVSYSAVPWHRAILLNETKPKLLRFGREYAVYFAILCALGLFDQSRELFALDRDLTPGAISIIGLSYVISMLIWFWMSMVLPGIAIGDQGMTPRRAWSLWTGNRIRFFCLLVFSIVVLIIGFLAANQVVSRVMFWSITMLDINLRMVSALGMDFALLMLSSAVVLLPLSVIACILLAGTIGVLSLAYAGVARRGMSLDDGYRPIETLRQRVSG